MITTRKYRNAGGAAALLACTLSSIGVASAKELLKGSIVGEDAQTLDFSLSAEDRANVVGGQIVLGERNYEVTKVSRHGLVGAHRFATEGVNRYAEFLVFSSSYSEETAVGTPWVAAREARHCDEPYNAFVAVYRVDGQKAVEDLGSTPYPRLVADVNHSDDSRVYCFVGKPAAAP